MRNGPVTEDVEMSGTNGANGIAKRKGRASTSRPSYAEAESSEEDSIPLVRFLPTLFTVSYVRFTT